MLAVGSRIRGAIETQGRRWLEKARAAAVDAAPDVTVETEPVLGAAVPVLVHASVDARMIVLGWRGRGGFAPTPREVDRALDVHVRGVPGHPGHGALAGMILGSTTQALVHHSPCPLAVVRPSVTVVESAAAQAVRVRVRSPVQVGRLDSHPVRRGGRAWKRTADKEKTCATQDRPSSTTSRSH